MKLEFDVVERLVSKKAGIAVFGSWLLSGMESEPWKVVCVGVLLVVAVVVQGILDWRGKS
jgi:hypothetical protein